MESNKPSQAKFIVIIVAIIAAALIGGFLAVRFFFPQTAPHQPGGIEASPGLPQPVSEPEQTAPSPEPQPEQVAPSSEPQAEQGFPVSFSSSNVVHNAQMRYGFFTVESYLWEFGDGETSAKANPTHVYKQPGSYSINITLTSTDGTTYSESGSVEVK